MCGIIGLHLRDPELHPMLGRLLDDMLCGVSERGPDSVGIAVYGDGERNPEGGSAVSVLRAPGDLADAVARAVAVLEEIGDRVPTPAPRRGVLS